MSENISSQLSSNCEVATAGLSVDILTKTRAKKKSRKYAKLQNWEEDRWKHYELRNKDREEAMFTWELGKKLGIAFNESEKVCKEKIESLSRQDRKAKKSIKSKGKGKKSETKLGKIEDIMVRRLWGKGNMDWTFKAAEGNSGGILTIWNKDKFQKRSAWDTRGLLAIKGIWSEDGTSCTLINVYAPNILKYKWELWDIIALIAEQYKDSRLGIIEDFNAIREPGERIGGNQKIDLMDMSKFDEFITNSNLT
ncbi:hypothetical protein ACS0TY_035764 [Phlomoides rotata]